MGLRAPVGFGERLGGLFERFHSRPIGAAVCGAVLLGAFGAAIVFDKRSPPPSSAAGLPLLAPWPAVGAALGLMWRLKVRPFTATVIGAVLGCGLGLLIAGVNGGVRALYDGIWPGVIVGGTLGLYWKTPCGFWGGAAIAAFWPLVLLLGMTCIGVLTAATPEQAALALFGGTAITALVGGVAGLVGGLIKITEV